MKLFQLINHPVVGRIEIWGVEMESFDQGYTARGACLYEDYALQGAEIDESRIDETVLSMSGDLDDDEVYHFFDQDVDLDMGLITPKDVYGRQIDIELYVNRPLTLEDLQ